MMKESDIFDALIKEALFTKELLGYGSTQIRRANYATRGLYFQAFSNLSIGLERIGKMCLILEHFIETHGSFPTDDYLKKSIGHDIVKIYNTSQTVITKRTLKLRTISKLDQPIYTNIMSILSSFARGDRYSNIDFLVGGKIQSDPIGSWYAKVDMPIYKNDISRKKKQLISNNAKVMEQLMGCFSTVSHTSEQGELIDSLEDASHRTGVFEAVSPKRQLYVLHIVRYWVELLFELETLCKRINQHVIPYFSEIFGGFANDDSYLRTRKTWDTI